MRYYVSLKDVSDEKLEFLGYVVAAEDDAMKLYIHFGDELIVDKSDPFMYVDDLNDANLIGGEVISVPVRRSEQ